jgi:hypothetical protein
MRHLHELILLWGSMILFGALLARTLPSFSCGWLLLVAGLALFLFDTARMIVIVETRKRQWRERNSGIPHEPGVDEGSFQQKRNGEEDRTGPDDVTANPSNRP